MPQPSTSTPHFGAHGVVARVFDCQGRLVTHFFVPRWFKPERDEFTASVALAPGRYRIEVVTTIGQRGGLDFAVDALRPDPTALPLPVR